MMVSSGAATSGNAAALGALGVAAALSMASMRACDALLPALAADFSVPVGAAAQSISAFVLAYGLLQLVYGPLGDRFGKLRVIAVALTACSIANVLAALAPTMTSLAAARGLSGAAAAGIIPMSMARIGDTVPFEGRQQVLARYLFATVGGLIAGQWLSGLIAEAIDWRAVFWVLATGFAVAALLVHRQASRAARDMAANASFAKQIQTVLGDSWARIILLITAIEGLFTLAGFAFVPAYLHRQFGLGLGAAGGVMAMYGAGGLAYVFVSRVLIRRLTIRALANWGGVFLGLGFATVATGPRWEWSLLGCFLGGLGFYMLHNTLQTQATQMVPQARGTAVGLFSASLFFGQAIGMAIAAVVVDSFGEAPLFELAAIALPVLAMAYGRLAHLKGH
jgi:YNFM family putative membrane transporter